MDTNNKYDSDVIEIDLMEIMGLLWHRAWIIVLCLLTGAVMGFCISKFMLTEKYESTTKVYILNKSDNNTLTYSDVQLGSQLTKDYAVLIKSRDVLEKVISNCSLQESYSQFAKRVKVESLSDTRIIAITVTDTLPKNAQILADQVRQVASEQIKNVMDIQAVNVAEMANLPESPASPNVKKWTLIAGLLGALLSVMVIVIHFMLDDTIKTSDDVEKYLKLSTLGMIPLREEHDKNKHGSRLHRLKEQVGEVSTTDEVDIVEIDAKEKSGEEQ